ARPPASQAAPAVALKVGMWEMTTVTENAAASSRRSIVSRSCITAGDSTNPQRLVPVQREPGLQCENRDLKRDGSTWSWSISCKSADATQDGSGKMSVGSDNYLGRAEVELKKKGAKPVKLGQTFAGKWVQACG
ncbi:MAG: DUF3617 domain-containing protein, partial [Ilumatobacteraceae bacterium]|nr:DUF3617 domain-containing protein [Ilumatobacteraceae bacterium]